MRDVLKKITHLQAAIRQLADEGRIKIGTKERIAKEVLELEVK